MKQITKILNDLSAGHISADEAESRILKLIPSNPMDIPEYAEEWIGTGNDYDLGFRAGMKFMHALSIKLINE